METRTRSRRVPVASTASESTAPESTAPARRGRPPKRRPAAEEEHSSHITREEQSSSAAVSKSKLGKLTENPVPRRGAQVEKAVSVASIPTQDDGEYQDEDEEDDENENADDDDENNEQNLQLQAGEGEDEEEQLEILRLCLPDLDSAAKALMSRFDTVDYDKPLSRKMLKISVDSFKRIREAYQNPKLKSVFLDYEILKGEDKDANLKSGVMLTRANLVTAMDLVEQIRLEAQPNLLPLLESLDSAFVGPLQVASQRENFSEIALKVRTCRLVEALAQKEKNQDPRVIIAAIFCQPTEERNYPKLFSSGPFKSLGGEDDAEQQIDMCAARVTEIFSIVHQNKKTAGVPQLRRKFDQHNMIGGEVASWIDLTYKDLDASIEALRSRNQEEESFHDAPEEPEISEGSVSDTNVESQIIRRVAQRDVQPSLFRDPSSIQFLKQTAAAPPSNQQQGSPSGGRAGTKRNRDNYEAEAAIPPPGREEEVEDEEEDEEFETDTRAVKANKRQSLKASMPAAKRPRASWPLEPQRSQPPVQPHVRAEPARYSSSALDHVNSSEPISPRDQHTIQQVKRAIIQQHRADARTDSTGNVDVAFGRQRHAWSANDSELLLELIQKHSAGWSIIETCGAPFEHPRNQQAYRDKARNMKVDYLITDTVLPPCFDLVNLGKKEVVRLLSLGKNPNRREADVDANGRPTKTNMQQG